VAYYIEVIRLRNLFPKGLKPLKSFGLFKFIPMGLRRVKGPLGLKDKTKSMLKIV
jgi:hypothetical protein